MWLLQFVEVCRCASPQRCIPSTYQCSGNRPDRYTGLPLYIDIRVHSAWGQHYLFTLEKERYEEGRGEGYFTLIPTPSRPSLTLCWKINGYILSCSLIYDLSSLQFCGRRRNALYILIENFLIAEMCLLTMVKNNEKRNKYNAFVKPLLGQISMLFCC